MMVWGGAAALSFGVVVPRWLFAGCLFGLDSCWMAGPAPHHLVSLYDGMEKSSPGWFATAEMVVCFCFAQPDSCGRSLKPWTCSF